MALSAVTNDFMRALPATLRPNPYYVEEFVMAAVEKGWETDALAKACYINDRQPKPAFVVTNLKTLCLHPPQQVTVRRGWDFGHVPCNEPFHAPECEICRCVPNEYTHHVSAVPRKLSLNIGRIPEENQ